MKPTALALIHLAVFLSVPVAMRADPNPPDGFTSTLLTTDIVFPTSLAFGPDGFLYVCAAVDFFSLDHGATWTAAESVTPDPAFPGGALRRRPPRASRQPTRTTTAASTSRMRSEPSSQLLRNTTGPTWVMFR